MPMPSVMAQSSTAVPSAPDCVRNASFPPLGVPPAKLAFSPVTGLMIPRQFGPMMRNVVPLMMSMSCASSATPGGPISLNPAEITTAPPTS